MSEKKGASERTKEPSTFLGVGQIAAGLAIGSGSPEIMSPEFIGALFVVLTGIIGIFKKETGK